MISDAKGITKPLMGAGTTNPACKDAEQQAAAGPENQRMIGLIVEFGKFRLLNLQDLDWDGKCRWYVRLTSWAQSRCGMRAVTAALMDRARRRF